MRLIDEILAAVDSSTDRQSFGAITSMANPLRQAQCFELMPEVVQACSHVAVSKPSSLLSAMPLTRLPYAETWIEWQPPGNAPHLGRPPTAARPTPVRMGCLFEAASPSALAQGTMSWAWLHKGTDGGLMILPYAVQFDWRKDGNVLETIDGIADLIDTMPAKAFDNLRVHGIEPNTQWMREHVNRQRITPEHAGERLRLAKGQWQRLAGDPKEQTAMVRLMERIIVSPNIHCVNLVIELGKRATPAAIKHLTQSWSEDLEGEPDFALAFIIMLNARSALDRTTDDYTRLNQRRALANKLPLREFVVTRLALSPTQNRQAAAQGITRAAARRHLVRGHFKVRRSGIFWWSPFVRGHGNPVARERYAVSR